MVNKGEVVQAMQNFSSALNKCHNNSATAQFVNDTLIDLKKKDGAAFTGALQYFFNKVMVVKLSDGIIFNETEKTCWHRVSSLNNLGNNLWGASL
ncbi:hypothetical protein [Companilactobacillus jidongensis]|uniref:hypothetical protein n=1 Tax=Companilactobacillus jidongensis TaxID=2486006 RepID=UPI000F7842E5|nr:hypothetical protein [Companilactobacillus jidongensis]